jgi:hypothetical protein
VVPVVFVCLRAPPPPRPHHCCPPLPPSSHPSLPSSPWNSFPWTDVAPHTHHWQVKGALSVFDCSKNQNGVYILDADPSVVCNLPGGVQQAMKPAAALSLVVYTVGLPIAFLSILVVHRTAIFRDQTLRQSNLGDAPESNPDYFVRKRYQELYAYVVQWIE